MVKRRELTIFFLLFILGLFLAYTYSDILRAKENIFDRIEKHKIEQISFVLKNLQEDIYKNNQIATKNDLVSFFEEKKIEKSMNIFYL